MTLLNDTERELDSLRYELVVQNSSSGSSSAVRDMERRLKRLEWRIYVFKQMKANYESAGQLGEKRGRQGFSRQGLDLHHLSCYKLPHVI